MGFRANLGNGRVLKYLTMIGTPLAAAVCWGWPRASAPMKRMLLWAAVYLAVHLYMVRAFETRYYLELYVGLGPFCVWALKRLADRPPATPVAVAVVRQEDRVLIGRRPPGVELAGLWEFPGGKRRGDESFPSAAARECQEETGLTVRISGLLCEVIHQYDYGTVWLRFFSAEPADPEQPPQAPYRWVPIDKLGDYPFPPANAAVLEQLK